MAAEQSALDLRTGVDGVELRVHVRPRATTDGVGGTHNRALQVRVRATPSKGEANAAVRAVLARALGIRPRAIQLVSGLKSREKRVFVQGDAETLCQRIGALVDSEQVV
jgi:uncharacterized protein (TIGR00251 family)